MILYLLSLEPSFLADLNLAQINLDESKLELLGPLSRVLFVMTYNAHRTIENEAHPKGIHCHNPEYNPLKQSASDEKHELIK